MHRTQIYLDDDQERGLKARAKATSRTKSAVIRDAIDAYLASDFTSDRDLERFRTALSDAAAIAPDLPAGEEYVREMRRGDLRRERELQERRESTLES